jgi:ribosome-associated heat shock protein Hsp15
VQFRVEGGPPKVVVVRGLYVKRVGAPVAATAYEDNSPPLPPKEERLLVAVRDRGAGRPTKRDRREIDKLIGDERD